VLGALIVVVVVVVVVGFLWLWLLPYSQVYLERIHIRVSGRFPCTDHAVQGTFGCSGLKEALVDGKVGRVFEMPGMQLGLAGVKRSVGMQKAGD
jgi:uncharacterized membrane protein YqiK